ncbi:CdaR family transcriptional regulator [Conexibacter sp. SYSU D00693]|uniref:PucR family transcriptional regulator n=1 Tax=Conexibacter sp. SYSU D00693 TaxID=2812560 RepID=UPI00196B1346|nr:helix-turn-helix domain-containing protein [Conexibacter sp. SYSU D00693]
MATLEEVLGRDVALQGETATRLVLERVEAEVPAVVGDPRRRQLAAEGTRALLQGFAEVLRLGLTDGFHAPPAALAFGQHLAREGVPLAELLRSYRLGQEASFARAVELAPLADEADVTAAVARIGLLTFRYADAAMADVAAAYDAEREASIRRDAARRDQVLRALLTGTVVDTEEAERVLGHRLDGAHVAVLAWRDGQEGEALVDEVRAALRTAGSERPLLVAEPGGAVVAWLTAPRWSALTEALAAAGLRAVAGSAQDGAAGFARSREQADLALVVARRGGDAVLTRYEDVALAALLTRDADAARRFADEELGPLAAPGAALLRATLSAFYAAAHDQSRTAHALGLHRNTVARRLARAEQLLGSPLTERVRERGAALVALEAL